MSQSTLLSTVNFAFLMSSYIETLEGLFQKLEESALSEEQKNLALKTLADVDAIQGGAVLPREFYRLKKFNPAFADFAPDH